MTTWILTGNDERGWDDEWWKNAANRTSRGHKVTNSWSTGVSTSVQPGDRFFLLRQGKVRGIVASGWCTSEVYVDEHFDDPDRDANYTEVAFDVALIAEDRLPTEVLEAQLPEQHWTPQGSGSRLKPHLEDDLEELWAQHLGVGPEDVGPGTFLEGAQQRVAVNRYERSPQARAACLAAHGTACVVCGFDFGQRYGALGAGRIVVHHLKELSTIKKGYQVDPVADLRPVCPNCHLMLHARRPAFTIDEVKAMLRTKAN
jgi:5-methylcytosine-specific restriction protein A